MSDRIEIRNQSDVQRISPEIVAPDTSRLQDYTKLKHALARVIRGVHSLASEVKNSHLETDAQKLMSKLAEDRFTLSVVGQFKRGKSSLMNAIIGREILPTGVLPLTSAITVLKYGPVERLTIVRERESIFPEQPPINSLAAYVTEEGNPGNREKLKRAVLELPVPFLKTGLEFVDTPGVGSAITANTQTTYAFLPECDAVVFVTSVDSPLTEPEIDFLRSVRQFAQKVFFVINKTDLLDESDRGDVVRFVGQRLRAEMRDDALKIYPLSASQGIAAKSSANSATYASSGLKEFEEALGEFLATERTRTFLSSVGTRTMRLLEQLSPQIPAGRLSVRWSQAKERLQSLQGTITPESARPLIAGHAAEPPVSEAEHVQSEAPVDWAEALMARGCPVCIRMADAAFDFYARRQHTLVVDESAQDQLAAAMGFCPLHTWQFVSIASPQGLSSAYSKLVERCAQKLSELAIAPDRFPELLQTILPSHQTCPSCQHLREVEESAIRSLGDYLKGSAAQQVYRDSQGVCLRHLGQLIRASCSPELGRHLLQHAARRLGEMAGDMQNFAMKHDGLRRSLQNADEKDAYLRAIVRLAGGRAVCAPWQEDVEI